MSDERWDVLEGDVLDRLGELPDGLVQVAVTSPPFWGLRDYGVAPRAWGGTDECEHQWLGASCEDCGAWLGCFGLEPSPDLYVAHLVEIMREVRRVLRDDGTLWLNLGDTYATKAGSAANTPQTKHPPSSYPTGAPHRAYSIEGLKPKDLVMIPARAGLALQADGWWLRSQIMWTKPNAMPESVTDRPTSAHETVLLLAKSGSYFYDPDGYREPFADERMGRDGSSLERERNRGGRSDGYTKPNGIDPSGNGGRNARNVWAIPTQPFPGAHFAVFPPELPRRAVLLGSSPRACRECGAPWQRLVDRQRTLDGDAYEGGTWDGGEGERLAGSRIPAQGVGHWRFQTTSRTLGWRPSCACGAPDGVRPGDLDWIDSPTGDGENRAADPSLVVGRAGFARPRGEDEGTRPISRYEQREYARQLRRHPDRADLAAEAGEEAFAHYTRTDTIGARPVPGPLLEAWLERGVLARVEAPAPWWDEDDTGRCVVLDPFAGAGTTGLVAVNEGRDFVGIELNDEYAAMARRRIAEGTAQMRLALD